MTAEDLKNVVIIGAATGGVQLARSLSKSLPSTHRVVLIEANPVAYWSIGALRASVLPGFEEKVVHDLTDATIFGSNTRHIVLAGTRVVDLKSDHVVVNRDVTASLPGSSLIDAGKTQIPIDRVALAIGADYGFPSRVDPSAETKADVLEQFRKLQKQIEAAQDILVIGGGPTGVEFVGEVLDVHPNKKVTLLTRGPGLVTKGDDDFTGLSNKLLSQLKSKGVRVILEDSLDIGDLATGPLGEEKTFTTKNGEKLTADFLLIGSGGVPNTKWVSEIDPSIVDSDSKLIKVSSTFQVTANGWDNYFAFGDCASTPGPKTSFMAGQHAPSVAHNVVSSIKGEDEARRKKAGGPPMNMIVVPFGKGGGASYMGIGSVGGLLTGLIKGRTLFLSQFEGWFKQ